MFNYQCRSILRRLAHLAVLAICAPSASAVALGSIQINSGLGQPLRANIPLLAVTAGELEPSCIKASVESADGAYLTSPQIGLISKGAPPAIVLSSKQAMMEPALTLRVSLSCGTSINREYQILLDPPHYDIATSSERQPSPAAGSNAEVSPAAAVSETSQPAAMPVPARRSPLPARVHKLRKPAATAPKAAAAAPKPTSPQRSVLQVTNADVAAAPIIKQGQASAPAPAKEPAPGSAPAAPALPASATASTTQPDLQMYALQAQMKDQIQALQKEMAAMRQQNQLDKVKFDELHKTSIAPQVMQGLVGLLLLCLGAIGWLGWRLYRLKNNYHLE